MQIEAVKIENGFLIPFVDGLQGITSRTIVLNVTLIESGEDEIDRFFDQDHIDLSHFQFDRKEANAR